MDRSDQRMKRLKEILQEKAVMRGEFTLTSGQKSSYYFDGRKVTHDAEGISLIGALVHEVMEEAGLDAIGGPARSKQRRRRGTCPALLIPSSLSRARCPGSSPSWRTDG